MRNKSKYFKFTPFIILVIIFIYIQVNTDLALPQYMQDIISKGIMNKDMDVIKSTGLEMIIITLIGGVATVVASLFASIVAAGISKNLREDVFTKVESFSLFEFSRFSTASLITRNTNDIQQIQMFIFLFLRLVVSAPIMAVGGIMKAIETSKTISPILAVSIPVTLIFIFLVMFFLVPIYNKVQNYIDKVNKVSREQLNGIRVIRAFQNEKYEEEKFDDANMILTKTNIKLNRIMVLLMPTTMLILNFMQLAIVWFGAGAIEDMKMDPSGIIAFINYAMQVMFSFIMMSMVSIILPRAIVSYKRIKEVLNTTPAIFSKEEAFNDIKNNGNNTIEFKNVSYSYPHAHEKVLDNINFTAQSGKVTAIIGSTGSGKSTLVNLIPRFYDVTEGEILINNINVTDYDTTALRKIIGYVPQKAFLFSGDIESNIKIGKEDATQEEIELAAQIAQSVEFINEKEEGYQSPIAQGGTNVSGGQKQRLAIARALIKEPHIYIFDDSFSALDFKTDKALRKALIPYTKDAVTIIVAQRISTIMNADQILVINDGKIVGTGTHKELLANCQVYQEIATSQLSKEELE